MNLQVGQKLWVETGSRPRLAPRWETILSVGRKWIVTDRETKICVRTLRILSWNGSFSGNAYLSIEDRDNHEKSIEMLRILIGKVQTDNPTKIHPDDIRAAAKLLRIEIDPTPDKGASRE